MSGRMAVGLDIGTTAVRAAAVSLGRGGASLHRFAEVPLPLGAVRNGEVVDVDAVAAAVRQLWSTAKFGSKKVVLGVANQKAVVRQVDLPWLPAKEMRAALPFQVQEYIPIPVDQAVLDFHPIEEHVADSGARMLRVLLVAAGRDMVNTSIEAVRRAGLSPVMVDLTPFAVLRSLCTPDELGLRSSGAEAIVDLGASVTNIIVHEGGVPRFVRILLMGGAGLTDAVAERMGVPVEQAELIKRSMGLEPPGRLEPEPHPAGRALESAGAALVDEIRGSLDYYFAQPSASRLDRVVLSGGGSQLGGLVERLSAAVRAPVELADPMSFISAAKSGLSDDELRTVRPVVSVPAGLAMGVAA